MILSFILFVNLYSLPLKRKFFTFRYVYIFYKIKFSWKAPPNIILNYFRSICEFTLYAVCISFHLQWFPLSYLKMNIIIFCYIFKIVLHFVFYLCLFSVFCKKDLGEVVLASKGKIRFWLYFSCIRNVLHNNKKPFIIFLAFVWKGKRDF